MLELDSIAVPVFAVWLNLTNTIYSIRMNMRRGALSILEHTLASCHQYIHRQQQHCHFSEKNPGWDKDLCNLIWNLAFLFIVRHHVINVHIGILSLINIHKCFEINLKTVIVDAKSSLYIMSRKLLT